MEARAASAPSSKITVRDLTDMPLFGPSNAAQSSALIPGPGDYHLFGVTENRQHAMARGIKLPFTKAWSIWEGELIEFPPAIAGDFMYLTNKTGSVRAVDISTGKTVWNHYVKNFDQTDPVYFEGRVFVGLNDGSFFALGATDGNLLWTKRVPSGIESSPVPAGGVLAVGSDDGTVYGVRPVDGRTVWKMKTSDAVKASPTLGGGRLFVADYEGSVFALEPQTGRKIWKQDTIPGDGPGFYSSPSYSNGQVFIGRNDGMMFALSARTGKVQWKRQLRGRLYGSPAVAITPGAPKSIYVGTHGHLLYALRANNGHVRWKYDMGGPIPGTASVVGNLVYTSTFDEDKGTGGHTVGLRATDGRRIVAFGKRGWGRGGYTPVISDGRNVFVIGYMQITAYRTGVNN